MLLALLVTRMNFSSDLHPIFSHPLTSAHTDIDNPEQDTWRV
jgi:hypothetical protein